jgi:hypothetical protein
VRELEQALAMTPSARPRARANLVAKLAEARRRSGQPFESRALVLEALQACGEAGDAGARALRLELAMDHYWHVSWSRCACSSARRCIKPGRLLFARAPRFDQGYQPPSRVTAATTRRPSTVALLNPR